MSHAENILPVFYSAVKTKQWKKRLIRCFTEEWRKNWRETREKIFNINSAPVLKKYTMQCAWKIWLEGDGGRFYFRKSVHDNGYGLFLSMLEYKLEERGKYLIKVNRYFASSKICSVCGKKKEELSLSERIYYCECGNRMDRDVNAAVNIMKEGRRLLAECAWQHNKKSVSGLAKNRGAREDSL